MANVKNTLSVLAPALLALAAVTVASHVADAHAGTGLRTSANVQRIPSRPDVKLSASPAADSKVSAGAALAAAEAAFGLSDAQIDSNIGIVRARVTVPGDPRRHNLHAWVVTANVDIMGQGPATWNLMYRKLCIVIDATTGRYVFAYTAVPIRVG